jgi:hypothetical protein
MSTRCRCVRAGRRPGWSKVARHALSVPGRPRIDLGHYPGHPQDPSRGTALADTQAHQRGRDGVPRARSRSGGVTAGRFAEDDLLAIVRHRAAGAPSAELVVADETHSAQPGTAAWEGFGR